MNGWFAGTANGIGWRLSPADGTLQYGLRGTDRCRGWWRPAAGS